MIPSTKVTSKNLIIEIFYIRKIRKHYLLYCGKYKTKLRMYNNIEENIIHVIFRTLIERLLKVNKVINK